MNDEGRPERRPTTDADQRRTTLARDRGRAIERRRAARDLEQVASLARYYGPRRPRPIPLGQFLVEGWRWAA